MRITLAAVIILPNFYWLIKNFLAVKFPAQHINEKSVLYARQWVDLAARRQDLQNTFFALALGSLFYYITRVHVYMLNRRPRADEYSNQLAFRGRASGAR